MRSANKHRLIRVTALAAAVAWAAWPSAACAYIGPGAGFAVVGSLGVVLATFLLALFALATYPFRAAFRFFRSRKLRAPTGTKGVVILGLDGLDPDLTSRFMEQGKLPNLKRLAEQGSFHKLGTTCPAMSPVAWSTFATGVDPSRHNIFDFLNRDKSTYIPILSSTEIVPPSRRLKLGPYSIPLGKPSVRLLRKSRPFWNILGDCYVSCHVIRVPITFPPEKCKNGLVLSAMCVPDLRGTQGSFTYFTTRPKEDQPTGGRVVGVSLEGDAVRGIIPGPPAPMRPDGGELTIPFSVKPAANGSRGRRKGGKSPGDPSPATAGGQGAVLEIQGQRIPLEPKVYTQWVKLTFKAGLGVKVKGICKFLLLESGDHFGLYMTPINIDPEKPAMPISQPGVFSTYLSKLQGSYATLGLAEDTWALNERVLDEDTFLDQAYIYHDERERMFFNSLKKNKNGLTACVFDATDRIQHMFLRHFDSDDAPEDALAEKHKAAIEEIYVRADDLVGRTLKAIGTKTVLMVISDHGFKVFKRGVNLNSWLIENGYMFTKDGQAVGEYLQGVDWSRTKAYTFGLSGIYINKKGRDRKGIVGKEDYGPLKKELAAKLEGLVDEEAGEVAIRRVLDTAEIYSGPYVDNGPDLIIGYNIGYRASWEGAVGKGNGVVFEDNEKSWGGDHCIDPELVPGVFFSNRKITVDDPTLMDISTSTLSLFGVRIPPYMKGRTLFPVESRQGGDGIESDH